MDMNTTNNFTFDIPKNRPNIIKVIGVGGAGGNAVNHMFQMGIKDVDFVVCNTDYQALERSPIPLKIQLGPTLTEGRGAGNQPEVGRNAAIENIEEVKRHIGNDTKMVFVTAGMGGGTGTGAAPIIAQACREMGILTVGIVTLPFGFEGRKRANQAVAGLEELRSYCDTTLVISNDKVREIYGNLAFDKAFGKADDVLATAAKGIAEIITVEGYVNVDFADVKTVLESSGKAVMGSAIAEGEGRALRAIETALSSPLLNDNDITGARSILLNISSGMEQITLDEIGEITDFIQDAAGDDALIIWGNCTDESLGDNIRVTVIATGFEGGQRQMEVQQAPERKVTPLNAPKLEEEKPRPAPITRNPDTIVYQLGETIDASENQPEKQEERSFSFEPTSYTTEPKVVTPPSAHPPVVVSLCDQEEVNNESLSNNPSNKMTMKDMLDKSRSRIQTLKSYNTVKPADAASLDSFEREPAYMRRNISLDQVQHSSEQDISRFTLSSNEEKRPEIRPNNSFLHDNVD